VIAARRWRSLLALSSALLAAGCTAPFRQVPDLGKLYDQAAQADDSARNPVIVIPVSSAPS
jgi:hypothetical protein